MINYLLIPLKDVSDARLAGHLITPWPRVYANYALRAICITRSCRGSNYITASRFRGVIAWPGAGCDDASCV